MNLTTKLLLIVLCVGFAAHYASADSLWAKGNNRTRTITTDDKAREVGDVITIVINERSTIANESSRAMEKSDSRSGSMDGSLKLGDIGGSLRDETFDFPDADFESSAGNSFEGDAEYDSDRSVTDRITVVVHDVLPGGNLLVLGQRRRDVSGDTQIVQVSGIVRPSDVDFDNKVASDRVADFRVVYKGTGQENNYTKPGWLGRAMNFLNPF
ncbi:MAG: flagellar basal body L-ring protein FlgH [Phycisphaerae bacterium]